MRRNSNQIATAKSILTGASIVCAAVSMVECYMMYNGYITMGYAHWQKGRVMLIEKQLAKRWWLFWRLKGEQWIVDELSVAMINERRIRSMAVEYRRLTEKDLEVFMDMRIHQLREEGAKEEMDLKPALRDYYSRHMADGTFVSWLAVDGDKIVGTSGMSFVEKPPYFGCPSGKMGLLSSMFTDKKYRRQGIAKELLTRVVNEAKEYGCGTVQITASDMGVLLYTNFGFVKNGNFMQYQL